MSQPLRGIILGAGYFSQFHADAWARLSDQAQIVAVCDLDADKASELAEKLGARAITPDELEAVIAAEGVDFVDLATPPPTHRELTARLAATGVAILCQKPLGRDFPEAQAIVADMAASGTRFMVHENWRWQPWYREVKRLLDDGTLGELFSLHFTCRMGDGWPHDAYLARQPYFRTYPRLFVYETGVHFLDMFRYIGGEVASLYARLDKRNQDIAGEDAALLLCNFANGATATLDASRYNEAEVANPRYTFGTMRVDGSKGHVRLEADGSLWLKLLGEPLRQLDFTPSHEGFAGDCVRATFAHFLACLRSGAEFETSGEEYLKSLALVEAAYQSEASGQVVTL